MIQTQRFAQIGQSPRRRGGGLFAPVLWLFGFVATAIAMAVGAVVLSRSCPDDSPLADEILDACRAAVMARLSDTPDR